MPWDIRENEPRCPAARPWGVVKQSDNSLEGCHMTREMALAQQRALYANEPAAARAEWDTAYINNLPDSAFAYIEPGGEKDAEGKTTPRSKRHFPLRNAQGDYDAAHVRNALGRAPQSEFEAQAMPKIRAAARALGIGEPAAQARADLGSESFLRAYPLEDIRILSRAQGSEYADGRTVEALVAVWDRGAEIVDGQGHYMETIGRGAFDKAINDARPQGSRSNWRVGVFYNHGMTLHGTPSDAGSVPLGSPIEIRADSAGLLTVTRYNNTGRAEEVLEAIRNGDITGHSFTGRIIKSNPQHPPRSGFRPNASGELQRVHRLELGLREYGPTPFPAYADTAVLSVRSFVPITQLDDVEEPVDNDTPSDEGAVTDEPPTDGHSSGDPELGRHAVLQRIALAKRTRPGLARPETEKS